ncbi:cytochrome b-c1 complex subunit 2, mitochondrial-like [Actinia tenebrosa]|uniref:Cytochrome b-c1 complex subunit 2, mitochondrial-like n=1 Tax=Actinia tenebrosa TaxID=6105 RepID=A0A6P8HQ55_ACTTE|nr:cytochrome b-c1 complex subunit 2, mitochondrial-like [Actinia tenebrosa]
MLPFGRAGPSMVRVLGRTAPSTQKLYASTAVPLSEPILDVQPKENVLKPQNVQVTTLDNGMKVASLETHAPTSKVGLFFEAGSRYEMQDNLGVSHFLRNAAFVSTQDRSSFKIARQLEQCGASLEASNTRDHLIFAADCKRDSIQDVLDSLASITTKPLYNPWELDEVAQRVNLDLAMAAVQPQISKLILDVVN